MNLNALTQRMGAHTVRAILLASGLLAIVIALMILFAPETFYAGHGIHLGGNVTLANEIKAPAGALLAAGLAMLAGIFRPRLAVFSLATATVVYLSYGFARVVSIVIDGLPHDSMVSAAGLELAIGLVCLVVLVQARRSWTH